MPRNLLAVRSSDSELGILSCIHRVITYFFSNSPQYYSARGSAYEVSDLIDSDFGTFGALGTPHIKHLDYRMITYQ